MARTPLLPQRTSLKNPSITTTSCVKPRYFNTTSFVIWSKSTTTSASTAIRQLGFVLAIPKRSMRISRNHFGLGDEIVQGPFVTSECHDQKTDSERYVRGDHGQPAQECF